MIKVFSLLLILGSVPAAVSAQVFYSQSFETEAGWSLSHSFDDGFDSYSQRAEAVGLIELGYVLTGADGSFVVAAEDSDGLVGEAPVDGVLSLTIDPVSIAGQNDLELVIRLSCNSDDEAYDERAASNGDYLDAEVRIDAGAWEVVGSFCSRAEGSSSSTLFHDLDMDGNGGELGEIAVANALKDFVLPISGTGNSAEIRITYRMNGSNEVIVIDNVRLKNSEGDVTAPQVFSASLIDSQTLELVYQEPMGANVSQTSFYAGIPDLQTATLQGDQQTVILNYGTPFTIGQFYQLVVFGVQDAAGNSLATPFSFPFYYNPSLDNLVITEIMYNDPSLADSLEFIEIYNASAVSVQLGGLQLRGAVSHTLEETELAAGGFYLAARNSEEAAAYYGIYFADYQGQFSDNSEEIRLENTLGQLIDSLEYNDNVPWPTAADGQGPSMELVDPALDNSIGSNWVPSDNGLGFIDGLPLSATPGFFGGSQLPTIQFDDDDLAVSEVDGILQFLVYVSGGSNVASVIELTISGGTATAGDDHGITEGSVTLPANSDGIEELAYALVNDGLDEGLEYIVLTISAVTNAQIGANSTLTILISDDDFTVPELYVNEVQADNLSTIQDEFDEFDDWIEIYNPNGLSVDLAGYYISDDVLNPLKDRIEVGSANTIVPAGGYLLLWADEDGSQGAHHVGFKLSAGGESVLLTAPDGVALLDEVEFSAMVEDFSYARFCDGEANWADTDVPTPGEMNCPFGIEEVRRDVLGISPNPTQGLAQISTTENYRLFDNLGRLITTGTGPYLDIRNQPKGLYHIVTEDGFSARLIKR